MRRHRVLVIVNAVVFVNVIVIVGAFGVGGGVGPRLDDAAGAAGAVGAAASSGDGAVRTEGAVGAGASGAVVPPGQDHDCIVGKPPPDVDWTALRNPILSYAAHGVKDQALQWSGGSWHMLFSEMTATRSAPHVRFDVAEAQSQDLRHWSDPKVIAADAASPDIVRDPAGHFVVTYQTPNGLEYRTASSASLASWSPPSPLAHGLAGRMIDGALAFTGNGVILGFKAGTTMQHFEIAWAPSLSKPFRLIGQPDIALYNDTVENYEFLTIDGAWHLVATSNTLDQPFVFTLGAGDPSDPTTWLHWTARTQLIVPNEAFNSGTGISSVSYEHANSGFLCVGPGGEDLLTYAGSTELSGFGGWGHARIGIARSNDLALWTVPPS
ncbi:MAG TPA: hypothetical protein VG346_13245 [Acidimicrobiales bacterium]|nr:hypothetical protein [Acidimicrobiales bacterium]